MTKVARDKCSAIVKNIRKRLLLEVLYKTAVLKNFAIFT